jgi:hypothetical protein
MRIELFSYRFADDILSSPKFTDIKKRLLSICENCPIPVYSGKSKEQPDKDVVQQIMNTYFKLQFKALNWDIEPLVTPTDNEDALRAEFRKTFINENSKITLQIEIEFGNVASSYRNFFKFQLSFSYDLTDICILVVPSANLANRVDSGIANYEKTIREIPQAKLSITVPTLVIGLFDKDLYGKNLPEWDIRQTGVSLDTAKNKNKSVLQNHENLVQSYIDKLQL